VASGIRTGDFPDNETHVILLRSGDALNIILINEYKFCIALVTLIVIFTYLTRKQHEIKWIRILHYLINRRKILRPCSNIIHFDFL